MSTLLDQARWDGGWVNQMLDVLDDSISFISDETGETLYRVDSSGYLTERGAHLGKFCLVNNRWVLRINDQICAEGQENGLFKLPEFELLTIVKLLNDKHKWQHG